MFGIGAIFPRAAVMLAALNLFSGEPHGKTFRKVIDEICHEQRDLGAGDVIRLAAERALRAAMASVRVVESAAPLWERLRRGCMAIAEWTRSVQLDEVATTSTAMTTSTATSMATRRMGMVGMGTRTEGTRAVAATLTPRVRRRTSLCVRRWFT